MSDYSDYAKRRFNIRVQAGTGAISESYLYTDDPVKAKLGQFEERTDWKYSSFFSLNPELRLFNIGKRDGCSMKLRGDFSFYTPQNDLRAVGGLALTLNPIYTTFYVMAGGKNLIGNSEFSLPVGADFDFVRLADGRIVFSLSPQLDPVGESKSFQVLLGAGLLF